MAPFPNCLREQFDGALEDLNIGFGDTGESFKLPLIHNFRNGIHAVIKLVSCEYHAQSDYTVLVQLPGFARV
jgi:hypothetical protein